jgi:hypothetical protein
MKPNASGQCHCAAHGPATTQGTLYVVVHWMLCALASLEAECMHPSTTSTPYVPEQNACLLVGAHHLVQLPVDWN